MEQTFPTEHVSKPNYSKTTFVLAMLSLSMGVIFVGLAQFGISLYDTFHEVQVNGLGDPKMMAGEISKALVFYVYYMFYAIPGWFLAMGVLLFSKYRSRKYYKFLIVIAAVMTLVFPFRQF
ncbi:hypothetical protein [Thalassotalea mangrovi]|uniref:Uncharacterized protein n=1 Tax=Thalassotalea mangrovi TaxID=2572245 RepID=A0A4U1B615_9GAMM|nr:hypothetical protein [Thalassotalea mangrovi]TKB45848.1 hypothetical protein E8M12_06270 [Thalassotalea mangrovi]